MADSHRRQTKSGLWPAVAVLVPLAISLLLVVVVWKLNLGHFTYTLDDPYIHLALAENIQHGHYGINLEEPSSPSSSVLYPLLLAAVMFTGLRDLAPLALNAAALAATLWTIWAALRFHVMQDLRAPASRAALVTIAMAICLNLIGVAFTGMEHTAHAFLTAVACYGIFRVLDKPGTPAWLVAALILQPLIRFEGAGILLAGAWLLATQRNYAAALTALGGAALALGAYAAAMTALGLPIFPSSVMVKFVPVSLSYYLLELTRTHGAMPALAALILFGYQLLFVVGISRQPRSVLVQAALVPIVLHLVGGRFGWLERYEIYLNVWIILMAGRIYKDWLDRLLSTTRSCFLGLALFALAFIRQGPLNLLLVPVAANNIFEQQYQMHRFVVDFHRGGVAVNDLGYVSYGNDHYVLDLWGLGSEVARKLRSGDGIRWVGPLVQERGIALAIVYDEWFSGEIPPTWRKAATLSLSLIRVSPAYRTVSIYATTEPACQPTLDHLQAFRATLPSNANLQINERACVQ